MYTTFVLQVTEMAKRKNVSQIANKAWNFTVSTVRSVQKMRKKQHRSFCV